ncbi:uncharacterized protein LOC114516559 [Dendronephthya gigantea]|uniref:uncharacterized protein LOC114516559 n=1 Tax=Dendronephthya gigantea TaxID=151771 RepID=UPI001069B0F5|nr:uncharacterized protein LOC114516559 [Dendronephthya gigantea]
MKGSSIRLTEQAQEYAEELALNDKGLVHCFNVEGCDQYGAAENLASAEGYPEVEANATIMWYQEIWDYNFCTTGVEDRNRPGREGKAIGHFTQLEWELSTSVGFGYARTSDRFKVYIVARYKPHGNVIGYYPIYVKRPLYVLDTFQDNCLGIDGGLSEWIGPGPCTRSCGGGVRFHTKACTNPKPSLNGRDCEGETKELIPEWCNSYTCSEKLSHRDLQCEARHETPDAHNFGGIRDCQLHCRISETHFLLVGHVDDGTHCDYDSGACVNGVCMNMPDYVVKTPQPMTTTTSPETFPTTVETFPTTVETFPTAIETWPTTIETFPTATETFPTSIETFPTAIETSPTTLEKISTTPETTTTYPTTPARRLVTGTFQKIMKNRKEILVIIPSGATEIVVQNSRTRNAKIFVRFQVGNSKPVPYRKKYGKEMMPFSEQVGRGRLNIMPMIAIDGPIKSGFKVVIYIRRRRPGRTTSVAWRYWTRD